MTTFAREVVADLRNRLQGDLVLPGDAEYDAARAIWNAMIDKCPALIVRCTSPSDVQEALRVGRAQGATIAVRGGGHNIAGNAVCDGGLVIDLSRMRSVVVDRDARRAFVDGGATLADVDRETQAFGLATPLGVNSTTGVAGLTLGGGFGWISRRYGLTVDNLVSADVVTPDGAIVRASARNHPDLFWALRGGGGNFGIVTRFCYALHSVGPEVLAGMIFFPASEAQAVLEKYRQFTAQAPDELAVWAILRKAPPIPFLPDAVHGTDILALAVCHCGDIEAGSRLVAPLRTFGTSLGDNIGAMPFVEWQKALDPLLTPGARNYWKSHNFSELQPEMFDTLVDLAGRVPTPECEVFIGQVGGASSRVAPDATAYPHRDARFVMNVHARWQTPADDAACIGWARSFVEATAPYATGGVYVNFMTADETDRVGSAYGAHYDKLARIKNIYDPENVLHMNQNIAPAKKKKKAA
ncbi:MAG: FAD-binding oxidoreductase [Polyangiaceae bacterium]|nr:FAD-binding oxidoreductase [Polyangiaceae bacterium]